MLAADDQQTRLAAVILKINEMWTTTQHLLSKCGHQSQALCDAMTGTSGTTTLLHNIYWIWGIVGGGRVGERVSKRKMDFEIWEILAEPNAPLEINEMLRSASCHL